VPSWLLRLVALVDPEVRGVLPELGQHKNASNEKARRVLGWAPRTVDESILATARSQSALGLLKAG
jgi:dihydroflavonol-4-reductase